MIQATELIRATIHEFYFEDAYEDTSEKNLSLFSLSNQDLILVSSLLVALSFFLVEVSLIKTISV